MRKISLFFLLVVIIVLSNCGTDDEGADGPLGSGAISFSEFYTPGNSAGMVSYLDVSKSGKVIFAIFSGNSGSEAYLSADGGESWKNLGAFNIPYSSVVTDDGKAFFENNSKLYIGTPEGAAEADVPYGMNGGIERRIVLGKNNVVYASLFKGFDWVIYQSADLGVSWTETTITSRFFNGQAAHKTAVMIDEQGQLYSMDRGTLYKSADGGVQWQQIPLAVDYSKVSSITSSYSAFYMTTSQDNHGHFFIAGDLGVAVIDPATATSTSGAFETAGLASHERFSGHFAADEEGNVYATITLYGYDYEFDKRAGAIYKLAASGEWYRFAEVARYTGFQNMAVFATDAGIVSAANGIFSEGVYTYNSGGEKVKVGAPEEELRPTIVEKIFPANNSTCYLLLSHPLKNRLEPRYSVLYKTDGNSISSLETRANHAFVTGAVELFVFYDDSVFVSGNMGASWEKDVAPLPNMFNNRVEARATAAVRAGDELVVTYSSAFGGVSGIYNEEAIMSADINSTNFQAMSFFENRPYISGGDGKVVYSVVPPIDFTLVSDREEEVYRSADGGATYSLVEGPMPIAGSGNGYFIAGAAGKIQIAAPGKTDFAEKDVVITGGTATFPGLTYSFGGADTQGVPVFPEVRFGIDNKLYFLFENSVYQSETGF